MEDLQCPICYQDFDHAPGCPIGAELDADDADDAESSNPVERITVTLKRDLRISLDKLAAEQGRNRSNMFAQLVREAEKQVTK
jgi:hypothetical protein